MSDDLPSSERWEIGRLTRLAIRIGGRLVVVLAVSVWIAWVIGGFGVLMIDPPLPLNWSVSLRIDEQGVILQKGNQFGRTSAVMFQKSNHIPWRHLFSDMESTWVTRWIVVSVWTSGLTNYGLIGIRHGLLLPVSLIALAIRYWLTSNRNHQNQPKNATELT